LMSWGIVPRAQVLEYHSAGRRSLLRVRLEVPNAYTHERALSLDPDRLTIGDRCNVSGSQHAEAIDWRLHLHPECSADLKEGHIWVRRAGVVVARLSASGYDSIALQESWYSPSYGVKVPTTCIVLTATGHSLRGTVILERAGNGQ